MPDRALVPWTTQATVQLRKAGLKVYYNDTDPFVCEWLHNLIAAEQIPYGD